MSYSLGTASGRITLDYDGTGVKKAQDDVDGLKKSSENTGAALNKVSTGMGVAGLAIAGALAVGVNAAANFEQRMSAVGAVSGASAQQMDGLRAKALQLGKDTQYSATESASAIEELVKAGLSVEDVLNGAADATVNLAAAGEIALPEAATIASNAMNQFGLKAEDMVGVVDNIAGAANASAIDVGDFGQSLSQVGAVANLAGVSFEDTATAIALMGNAGIKGSDAGTSLKSMFQRLQPTTKKQIDLMKELGIITKDGSNQFYDAQGNMKSMADVSQVLKDSLKGMTKQQQQATLTTLFGSDAIRGAAVLADQGAAGFNKMGEAMGKVSAADVAAKRMDNFKGSLEEMKGSLETVGIQIGSILLPMLRRLVDFISKVLDAFLGLPSGVQKAIVAFAAIAAGLLLAGAATIKFVTYAKELKTALTVLSKIGAVGKVLGVVKTAFMALGTAVRAFGAALLANPIFLIIAGLVALGVALVILYKKSETFRNIVNGVWAAIKAAVMAVVNWFMSTVLPVLQSVWNGITVGLNFMKGIFLAVWSAMKTAISVVLTAISTVIMFYFNLYKTIITTALGVIKSVWGAIWGTFGPLVKAVWELIKTIITLGIKLALLPIYLAVKGLKMMWKAGWSFIQKVIPPIWNAIKSAVKAGSDFVKNVVTSAVNKVKAVWNAVWGAISGFVSSTWGKIRSVVSAGVNFVKGIVSSTFNALKGIASKAWSAVDSVVGDKIRAVMDKVRSIGGKIKDAFANAGSWLLNAGKQIIQGLISGVTSKISALTSKLKSVTNLIPSWKGPESTDKKLLKPAGQWIMEGLIGGIGNRTDDLRRELRDISDMFPATVDAGVVSQMLPVVQNSQIVQPGNESDADRMTAGWDVLAEKIDEQTERLSGDLTNNGRSVLTLKRQGAI